MTEPEAGSAVTDLATSATPEQVQALFTKTVPVGAAFGVDEDLPPEGLDPQRLAGLDRRRRTRLLELGVDLVKFRIENQIVRGRKLGAAR